MWRYQMIYSEIMLYTMLFDTTVQSSIVGGRLTIFLQSQKKLISQLGLFLKKSFSKN